MGTTCHKSLHPKEVVRIPESGPIGAGGVLNARLNPPRSPVVCLAAQVGGLMSALHANGSGDAPGSFATLWAIEEYWGRSLPWAPPVIKASIPRKSRAGDDYQVMARAQPRALSPDPFIRPPLHRPISCHIGFSVRMHEALADCSAVFPCRPSSDFLRSICCATVAEVWMTVVMPNRAPRTQ